MSAPWPAQALNRSASPSIARAWTSGRTTKRGWARSGKRWKTCCRAIRMRRNSLERPPSELLPDPEADRARLARHGVDVARIAQCRQGGAGADRLGAFGIPIQVFALVGHVVDEEFVVKPVA